MMVTNAAVACFQRDWEYRKGDFIRIYVRYSGGGEDAFAFGITKDEPQYPVNTYVGDGITFFMEENDAWYLDGRNLTIDCLHGDIVFARG
ncbi:MULTISPECIES: HesB/YadR/YfhF family protein [unclassified Paenibacillus]|uniref:HesB/YadR/YfhF family protein n=1 Tax=unclassified Paenibacillus TaxID=185978 RepID=UPI00288A8251|nr:Fe-S cluster assembly protein HesB [Paenibacillus sp. MER TA 81-3]